MIITEETLREDPSWIVLLMGLPAETFWQLIEAVEKVYPNYERQRHQRPDRKRGVGGGRKCDLVLVMRVALVLTYLRLHVIQALVAKLFGATQSDVSRGLRRLLPLLKQVLPWYECLKIGGNDARIYLGVTGYPGRALPEPGPHRRPPHCRWYRRYSADGGGPVSGRPVD